MLTFPLRTTGLVSTPSSDDEARKIASLVVLTTRLADRMDALPSLDRQRDGDRRARVLVLRGAAEAGTRALSQRAARGQ